ncbi:hypothetical protein [Tropicimonas sp. S265A]|uniref:hypothetical protein n=1 Tax=Tropicimonas sp. S265A TaxID=3415134 RepID=UPI003C7C1C1C
MARNPKGSDGTAELTPKAAREARLKAALKANMGRRKAQARARKADAGGAQDKTSTATD